MLSPNEIDTGTSLHHDSTAIQNVTDHPFMLVHPLPQSRGTQAHTPNRRDNLISMTVTDTSRGSAEITWSPGDDPTGCLARAVESEQLAHALPGSAHPGRARCRSRHSMSRGLMPSRCCAAAGGGSGETRLPAKLSTDRSPYGVVRP